MLLTLLSQSPLTPTRYVRNSLALNFKESPPDQPMFDLSKPRRSISSSVLVHHSSPITVPSLSKQGARFSVSGGPATLAAGTVPTTPGPFQKALEIEETNKIPSPLSSATFEWGGISPPLPTPMPGTNLTLEDVCPEGVQGPSSPMLSDEPSSYFAVPVPDNDEKLIDFDQSQYDCEAARQASAEALKDLIYDLEPTKSEAQALEEVMHDLEPVTSEAPSAEKCRTLRKKQTFNRQSADRIGLEPCVLGSADDGPTEDVHLEGIEHIVWEKEKKNVTMPASPEVRMR